MLISEETEGRINAMPAYLGGNVNLAGIKWVGSSPANPSRHNMPRASAVLILNDKETKLPLAIMEATIISAMRTGAVGGIAAKYLARKDSTTCGIIGAGVQARTQAMAVKVGLPGIKRFIVYDIDSDRASTWCEEMSEFFKSVLRGHVVLRGHSARGRRICYSYYRIPSIYQKGMATSWSHRTPHGWSRG